MFHQWCARVLQGPSQDQAVAAGLYPSSRTFAALLEAALSVDDAEAAEYWYQGLWVHELVPGAAFPGCTSRMCS